MFRIRTDHSRRVDGSVSTVVPFTFVSPRSGSEVVGRSSGAGSGGGSANSASSKVLGQWRRVKQNLTYPRIPAEVRQPPTSHFQVSPPRRPGHSHPFHAFEAVQHIRRRVGHGRFARFSSRSRIYAKGKLSEHSTRLSVSDTGRLYR